jgi:simple sugar transport system ATP-binding protein
VDLHRGAHRIVSDTPALELAQVSKTYGAVVALDDASLIVRPGTVHAVLGENGAGKTTLMRVAYGMVRADAGTVRVAGRDRAMSSPQAAIAAGIGMVHQHFTLVPAMTVQENLALGGHGRLRARDMAARVRDIAERTGFALDPEARVDTLPVGAQQRVEITKALARDARVLILDEPTAVLAPSEVDDLLTWLRQYVAAGNAAVLITHKLHEALAVADDLTILRRGRVVFTGSARETSVQSITEAMIGAAPDDDRASAPPSATLSHDVVFEATGLSVADPGRHVRVRDATFIVRRGEMVSVAAVEGAGQHELLRALAGRYPVTSGTLVRPAIVGFVPEDRHAEAVLLDRSLTQNVALRGAGARRGVVDWSSLQARTELLLEEFDIRSAGADAPMRSLSGGNQQKLVLARELAAVLDEPAPEALVVENPTRGLDVRAAAAVHKRLREACVRGAAVVVYSSDLDEALSLSSRVLVMFGGTVRELPASERDAIGRAMLGSSQVR